MNSHVLDDATNFFCLNKLHNEFDLEFLRKEVCIRNISDSVSSYSKDTNKQLCNKLKKPTNRCIYMLW